METAYHTQHETTQEDFDNLSIQQQMETTITRPAQTEQEYIAQKQLETALIKHQQQTIAVGIVTAITPIPSKFGVSFKVTVDHGFYFYNSTVKDPILAMEMIKRMMPINSKVAFQYKSKTNGTYVNKTIESLFYTF